MDQLYKGIVMKNFITVSVGLMLTLPAIGFATDSKYCSLPTLQSDKGLNEKITIAVDPAGLAVEPKTADTNVVKVLQHYVDEHQCTLSSVSMGDLVKGLFKGSADAFPQGVNTDGSQSTMNQKYIIVAKDVAGCIKTLGLELPVKKFAPIPVKFCSLQGLQSDTNMKQQLKFSHDQVGLAVESKKSDADVEKMFKDYAVKHHCTLYSLSMNDLMKGLFKGSASVPSSNDAQPNLQGKSNKYLLVEGGKAICVKKLGLELPLKAYLPS